MSTRPTLRSVRAAFTLIELLTVMVIIAILVGLLLTGIQVAKVMAHKADAKMAVTTISTAVRHYYTEYGKYPLGSHVPDPNSPSDVLFGDANISNRELFDILRNVGPDFSTPNPYNPKGIPFLESRIASDPIAPKSGFAPQDAGAIKKGAYVDPWGNEYRIAVDADGDNHITNLPYTDFQGTNSPEGGVAAFSLGKDGALGRNGDGAYRSGGSTSDDIISWQ
jgi:prepilin-type N-terminal cleavage/methylation domain-containing protein